MSMNAPAAVDPGAQDQRETQRHRLDLPANVSIMGTSGLVLHGQIRNLSEGGTQVWLDQPLPLLALVRIEYDDNLLLGEVVYCQQEQSGWIAGIHVEHGLFGLAVLARAMQEF